MPYRLPPIVTRRVTPRLVRVDRTRSRCSGFLVGLAREVPKCEPPRKWMRLTSSMEIGCTCAVLPSMSHLNPSRKPSTSEPPMMLRIVTALMTLLMPGAGPPPTSMPTMGRDALTIDRLLTHGRCGFFTLEDAVCYILLPESTTLIPDSCKRPWTCSEFSRHGYHRK